MIEQNGDDRTGDLPDGTDTIINGAAELGDTAGTTTDTPVLVAERESPQSTDRNQPSGGGSTTSDKGLGDRLRSGREQFASQAGDKARGLVTQGLERTSETLANVSKMVGDTAAGIEERLGPEYGDYARRAAGAIENAANSISEKDPDELIEDTRNFVRNSPGVALAGAAIVGFALARLIKSGLGSASNDDDNDG